LVGEVHQESIADSLDDVAVMLSHRLLDYAEQRVGGTGREVVTIRPVLCRELRSSATPDAFTRRLQLVHQVKKGQFDLSALCPPDARTPPIWEAVLAA